MIFEILANLVLDSGVEAIRARRRRTKAEREPLGDDVACSMRVIDGTVPGLTARWTTGHAVLKPGQMIFNGLRIPVLDTPEAGRRPVHGREAFFVNPDCSVVQVDTKGATLEWAVLTHHVTAALYRVAP